MGNIKPAIHRLTEKFQAVAWKATPNYLVDDLPVRLENAPAKFKITMQLASKGDEINDPTVVWPETRKEVELGTIVPKNVDANGFSFEKSTMYNP